MRNKEKEKLRKGNNIADQLRAIQEKKKAPDSNWAELESFYQSIGQSIVISLEEISAIQNRINSTEVNNHTKEQNLLVTNYINDVNIFGDELELIHNKHKDKKGYIRNEDDLFLSYDVGNQYHGLNIRFTTITQELMSNITIKHIEDKHGVKVDEVDKDLTDPNVISDIEIIPGSEVTKQTEGVVK